MKKKLLSILFFVIFYSFLFSDNNDIIILPDIEVTGILLDYELFEHIKYIDNDMILINSKTTLTELANTFSNVDIRHRGTENVQSDVSIRGTNFEQNIIMINGIKINNIQTGHHNTNIPVPLNMIERIEIIPGTAANLYGEGAFGGAINIITKKEDKKNIYAQLAAGSHSYFNNEFSTYISKNNFHNLITYERKISDGYRENTEYKIKNIFLKTNYSTNNYLTSLQISGLEKEFGANGFYTLAFPEQWEKTKSLFTNINFSKLGNNWILRNSLSYQYHYDNFILDRTQPDWYNNLHKTYLYNAEIYFKYSDKVSNYILKMNYEESELKSNSLSDHTRRKFASVFDYAINYVNMLYTGVNLRIDNITDYNTIYSPFFNILFKQSDKIQYRSSIGKTFRTPSFTELYYEDPVHINNPDLKYEKSHQYEIGAQYTNKNYIIDAALFYRDGSNIIDWVKNEGDDKWMAEAIADIQTTGIDLSFNITNFDIIPQIKNIRCEYSVLNSSFNVDYNYSKYVLDYLKHKFVFLMNSKLPLDITNNFILTYNDRNKSNAYILLDTKFTKIFEKEKYNYNLFLNINNLNNQRYEEITGLPMPGRTFKSGITVNF